MTPPADNHDILPMPEEQMPKCWKDENRMMALYAPFRNRAANPEDWNSKFKFWRQMINDWCSYHAKCCFTLPELNLTFKRKGCIPIALPIVLQELYKSGEIVQEADFLKQSSSTWTGWALDSFIKKPASWSWSIIKNYVTEPVVNPDARYVHIATVRDIAEIILSTIDESKENTLIPLCELTIHCIKKSKNNRITEDNVKLALIYLRNLRKASFRETKNENKNLLVKVSPTEAQEVTEVDEGVHKLVEQEKMLVKNLEQLEVERNEVMNKAKSSLGNGLKQLAKSHLRKKHELDKTIEKRSSALHNVQTLLSRIQDAKSDTHTLKAYKAGYNALKKFEDTGLTEDNVKNTMDDVHEIFEELEEVQSVMTTSVLATDSDSELEKELAEIMGDAYSTDKSISNPDKSNISCELPDLENFNLQELPVPKATVPPSQPTQTEVIN